MIRFDEKMTDEKSVSGKKKFNLNKPFIAKLGKGLSTTTSIFAIKFILQPRQEEAVYVLNVANRLQYIQLTVNSFKDF